VKVAAIYPKLVWPLPLKALDAFAKKYPKTLVPEINKQGQLASILRMKTDMKPISYNIYGGMPFTPQMIVDKIKEVSK
ncbi:MAG: 2-oxoacid:acceptor oxidoreductase subunit alpha, partial [Nitrospinota bacterium]|nr:2-oxoacid:acceptor oxidoreductase subunit alpha [Nitrospinota bacterium]